MLVLVVAASLSGEMFLVEVHEIDHPHEALQQEQHRDEEGPMVACSPKEKQCWR